MNHNASAVNNHQRSKIHWDRDYHIHLGGAIPIQLVAKWIEAGKLSDQDQIMDFHSRESFHGRLEPITIKEALIKYRGNSGFLEAYQEPYQSLEDFLTLYRAYSRHDLVHRHAAEIAETIYPKADIRMSVPFPPKGDPVLWAENALQKACYYQSCFQPEQQLILLFPRNHFTGSKNVKYWKALIDCLRHQNVDDSEYVKPAFDFAAVPIETAEMVGMLAYIRDSIPGAFIAYHHGETCLLPLDVEVFGTKDLLPFIDRMGHGMSLGLAAQKIACGSICRAAHAALDEIAQRSIGIEVAPSGNAMINGDVGYYHLFLEKGIELYVGTDDPGFTGSHLEAEIALLCQTLNAP